MLWTFVLKGYMLICRNVEGVHGQRKVGNPWYSVYTVSTIFQHVTNAQNSPSQGAVMASSLDAF